jgi:hypothetical protein
MLLLALVLLLVAFVLSVLFWVGSLWFQAYIYESPSEGLAWRGPAAGAALAAFLALWCLLDYRTGFVQATVAKVPFDTWWDFTITATYPRQPVKRFWSVKKDQEGKEKVTEYVQHRTGGLGSGLQYVDPQNNNLPWSREGSGIVRAVILEEDGQKVRFNAQLTDGKFKDEPARYVEEGGTRSITEEDVKRGQLTETYPLRLVVYLVLNVLHLGLWFVCLWLLLRYQWTHALGLGVVLFVATSLLVFPLLMSLTKDAVRQKPAPEPAAGVCPRSGAWESAWEGRLDERAKEPLGPC